MKGYLAITTLFLAGNVLAADLCEAIALRDVPAIESPDSILQKGENLTAITQYRENKNTKLASFCSHGGYCYPRYVYINGEKIESLQLTNCKIGEAVDSDEEDIFYSVDVERKKNKATDLKKDDLENKLLEMGLCNACADNVAQFYIQQPSSECAKLTKEALEGNPEATSKLQEFPDYCTWKY